MKNTEFETFYNESLINPTITDDIKVDIESKIGFVKDGTKESGYQGRYGTRLNASNIPVLKIEDMNELDRLKYLYTILSITIDYNEDVKSYVLKFSNELKYLKNIIYK